MLRARVQCVGLGFSELCRLSRRGVIGVRIAQQGLEGRVEAADSEKIRAH